MLGLFTRFWGEPMDIEKSRAEALYRINQAQLLALLEAGLMEKSLALRIAEALRNIRQEQTHCYTDYLELEDELIRKIGKEASNLHLGRSRNDIGATTERILIRSALLDLLKDLSLLRNSILVKAEKELNTIIPAYTHSRLAQPTTMGHYLLALADSLARDMDRFRHAFSVINQSPLGAGALTTSGFRLNRGLLATALAFEGVVENSYDAVSIGPGDSKAETAGAIIVSSLTLSRLIQDLILYSMEEMGFLILSNRKLGGSSIMPQKRNPGFLESARSTLASILGKCWSVYADLHNTHLQDTKDVRGAAMVHVVEAAGSLRDVFSVLAEGVSGITVDSRRGLELARANFSTATELADALVRYGGIDFRSAHGISSAAADWLRTNQKQPEDLDPEILGDLAETITGRKITLSRDQLRKTLSPEHFVEIRDNLGGPAEKAVRPMIRSRKEQLQNDKAWIGDREQRIFSALKDLDRAVLSGAQL